MSSPASRIAIIGAGIGGFTLALLLRRRGITAEILEQAPELREVGAAVSLAANGTRVLQRLDLGDGLAQASSEFTEIIYRDGRDGSRIAAHALGRQYREAFGAPIFGLHRIALQQLLAGAWGAGHLHLGCRAETLQEHGSGMRVRRAPRSTPPWWWAPTACTRRCAAGSPAATSRATPGPPDSAAWCRSSGCRGCPTPAPCNSGWGRRPPAALFHRGRQRDQLPGGRRGTQAVDSTGLDGSRQAGRSPGGVRRWHLAVSEMIGAVPQSPRWGLFALPPLRRWSRGPVVLLVDAAHGMLPHHGQGASQTIEDAAVRAAELDGAGDVAVAVRQYEARRRVRTRQVQAASWATSAVLHLPDGPAAQVRDAYLASLPERLAWIHGYDILAPSPGESSERRPNPARSRGGSR